MPNTSLGDLSLHLFAELERLGDEELKGEALKEEIGRAKAVSDISKRVIENANTVLRAQELIDNRMNDNTALPKMLQGE